MWTDLIPKYEDCVSYWNRARVARNANSGAYLLSSYGTVVCIIDAAGRFHRSWKGWSRTTSRHVIEFFRQFGGKGPLPYKAVWLGLPVENPRTEMIKARDALISMEAKP